MTELASAVLGALLGALMAGVLAFVVQTKASERLAQRTLTMELYREWQSEAMLKNRIRASELLLANLRGAKPASLHELFRSFMESGREDDWVAISRLVHFFESLGVVYRDGWLADKLFWSLFEIDVTYWREELLNGMIALSLERDAEHELAWTSPIESLDPGHSPIG